MQNTLRYDYTGDSRFLEGADWFGCRPAGLQLHFHDEAQVSVIWNGYRDYRIGREQVRLYPGQLLIIPELRPHLALPSMHDEVRSVEFYLAPAALSMDTRLWLANADFAIIEAPFLKRLASCEVAERTVSCIADKIGSGRRPAPPYRHLRKPRFGKPQQEAGGSPKRPGTSAIPGKGLFGLLRAKSE